MNNDLLDAITLVSFGVALQNLKENEQQSESLKKHLESQDGVLEEQTNIYLKKIIEQNEQIISLLEGGKNGKRVY